MAIYGTLDAKAMGTAVVATNGDATVTTAGDFTDASDNLVKVGDILELSGVAYIVREVTSATALELHTTYAGSTATIAAGSAVRRTAPKAVAEFVVKGGDTRSRDLVFVDTTEQALDENKSRGITGPGWWLYETYVTHNGDTRHKAECLAFVHATAGAAGDDADDTIVADVLETITIGTQPADQNTSSGAATFTVAATVDQSGTITYQWQKKASGSTRYANVSGATSASIVLSGQTADNTGDKYRVKVNTSKGAEEVVSDAATLTFVS